MAYADLCRKLPVGPFRQVGPLNFKRKTEKTRKLRLNQKDFGFCVELPIKAKKTGLKMISSNSYERKRIGGKKKVNAFKDGFLILIFMIKLFFWKKDI